MKLNNDWPGIQHMSDPTHIFPKRIDTFIQSLLTSLVQSIDKRSYLGEWGVRFCLAAALLLFFFQRFEAGMIPLIILLGSMVRFTIDNKKSPKKHVSVPSDSEQTIEDIIFKQK